MIMATIFVIICLLFLNSKVEGISKKYENKPISIKTKHGEVYDCINFYEQPAFDNPLLKNITSKLTESNLLSRVHTRKASSGFGLKGESCPNGTVPILRINGERKNHRFSHIQGDPPDYYDKCYAIVRTNREDSIYNGVTGKTSIYNPKIVGPQWSQSRMGISNGVESIEVGWMVNEEFYKDNNTHLYIGFNIIDDGGCFDLHCPGFVQVAKDHPIGIIADHISHRGYNQWLWTLLIEKREDGNWWVSIGNDKYEIGYWPKTLFRTLSDTGNQVEWGGVVYFVADGRDHPEMGCGYKASYDTLYAAFWSHVAIVDQHFRTINPPRSTVKYDNCGPLYNVLDTGYTGPKWGRIILFGGTGD